MSKRYSIFIRCIISSILAILICILFIEKEYRYAGTVVSSKPFEYERQHYYFDLNYDGRSEKALFYTTVDALASLILYEWDGSLIEQYNLEGNIIERSELFSGDYNLDGTDELFIFTHLGDSLFLNVVDPFLEKNQVIARKYIDGCKTLNGAAKYSIDGSAMEDMNGDGRKEFYFSINAGFTLSPRAVFCYDLINDSLMISPISGSGPRYSFRSEDIDGDGFIEIMGESTAYNNYRDSIIPFSDSSAWLMVFSHLLKFEFPPIEFPGFGSILDVRVFQEDKEKKLVALRIYRGNNDLIENEILLIDTRGNIEKRASLPGINSNGRPDFHIYDSRIFINNYNGGLLVYNEELELVSEIEKDWLKGGFSGTYKIQDDAEMLIFSSRDGSTRLIDHSFKTAAFLQLDESYPSLPNIQSLNTVETPDGMLVKTQTYEKLISWNLNPRRNFIYLYWLAITCTLYAFIYTIQYIQTYQVKGRIETENKLRTLQLQSLKSQMNPHFIFNALNSISAMYMTGNSTKAQMFLVSFSRMIREVVDSSDRVIVPLQEEIAFVTSYLELEKVRHGENFTFTIEIPDDCKDTQLPSMSIHAFVENSVKHAFIDKSKKMVIEVVAHRNKNQVELQIRDNGIGFGNAENATGRVGRGMKMVSEIISSYSKISGKKMQFSYSNLNTWENAEGGSLVEVIIEA